MQISRIPTSPAAGADDPIARTIGLIGPARGFSLKIGTYAVLCATATDAEERALFADQMTQYRRQYCEAIKQTSALGRTLIESDEIVAERKIVHGFIAMIEELPDDGVGLSRSYAAKVAHTANKEVLPSIYGIIGHLEDKQAVERSRAFDRMAERADMTDRLMADMDRISRMIGLISINASVEAARTGGQTGRAFQVIAQEVRSLARQSADLLERMAAEIKANKATDQGHPFHPLD